MKQSRLSALPPFSPGLCSTALADYTRGRREELGLSIERAAQLAGMELSDWCALESGWPPEGADPGQIHAVADTLQVSWIDYSILAMMASWDVMSDATRDSRKQ